MSSTLAHIECQKFLCNFGRFDQMITTYCDDDGDIELLSINTIKTDRLSSTFLAETENRFCFVGNGWLILFVEVSLG